MGRTKRKLVTLTVACATIAASPAILGAANAHAAVAGTGLTPIPAGTYTPLPLGDPALTETRSTETLAPGVTLTHIVRGTAPANPADINTTLEGPWIVNVVTIDPHKAVGHLQVVRGQFLTNRTTVSNLVAKVGGLAGINASFFDIGDNFGVPDALAIDNGQLIGDPGRQGESTGPIVNSQTNKLVLNGTYTWSGTVQNTTTLQTLPLTHIDKKTTVPSACATLADQTQCTVPGDLVHFDPIWGPETPTGPGVEVVLDAHGAVVSTATTRGAALQPGQTSIQATGSDAAALLNLIKGGGRLKTTMELFDNGEPVPLTPNTQATTGSRVLIDNGVNQNPEPNGDTGGSRNPETSVSTTRDGKILLVTVDGRSTASVGVNFPEESAMLVALGGWNAEGLDGGGSTELVANGSVINTPSDGSERPDGDALVWVP